MLGCACNEAFSKIVAMSFFWSDERNIFSRENLGSRERDDNISAACAAEALSPRERMFKVVCRKETNVSADSRSLNMGLY